MRTTSSLLSIDAGDHEETAAEEVPATPSYILIVDDEPAARGFFVRCLEGAGYAVKQADGAAEALETILSQPPAAVLCDVRMPDRDGLWLAERVHEHWPEIPIVMTTGLDDPQTIRKSRELGAVDYLAKPISRDSLLEVLQRVTAGRRPIQVGSDQPAVDEARVPDRTDADYTLETPVRCPVCGERVEVLKAVRLIRARVNFTSTLPRRGRVMACPHCLAIVPAELTNF